MLDILGSDVSVKNGTMNIVRGTSTIMNEKKMKNLFILIEKLLVGDRNKSSGRSEESKEIVDRTMLQARATQKGCKASIRGGRVVRVKVE